MLPQILLFLNLGTGEVFLIVLMIIMFFGTKNLPQLARGLGKGIRDFREAAGNIQREIQSSAEEVRKNTNLDQEIREIREAANVMRKDIQEGLDNIDRNIQEGLKEEEQKKAEPKNEALLEEGQQQEQTAQPETEKQETPVPPQEPDAQDQPLSGSIKRG